jgi:hypothetical protein
MAVNTTLSVEVQPGAIVRYTAKIAELAAAARKKREKFTWGTYQTLFGERMRLHFVSSAEGFGALQERGTPADLVGRVLGDAAAPQFLTELGSCVAAQRMTVSVDRPDLSHVRNPLPPGSVRAASVTRILVRPGARDAFEELMRRLAEAIPKMDEPLQLLTRQVVIGNLAEYLAILPLQELRELDAHRAPELLLTEAFGPGEGGHLFRTGGEAVQAIEREIVSLREELSNPPA